MGHTFENLVFLVTSNNDQVMTDRPTGKRTRFSRAKPKRREETYTYTTVSMAI